MFGRAHSSPHSHALSCTWANSLRQSALELAPRRATISGLYSWFLAKTSNEKPVCAPQRKHDRVLASRPGGP